MFPIIKCYGGAYYLSDWIISLFPNNYQLLKYFELYFGGGSVFWNKISADTNSHGFDVPEHINDINPGIIELLKMVKSDPNLVRTFINETPYTKETLEQYQKLPGYSWKKTLVLSRFSRSGKGKTFAWSERQRGGYPGDMNAWLNLGKEGRIREYHDKLVGVRITNEKAVDILKANLDDGEALFYLDPPFPHGCRIDKRAYGEFEMTDEEHEELLKVVKQVKGRVLLQSYPNVLYDTQLTSWNRFTKTATKMGGNGLGTGSYKKKVTHTCVIWRNF